MGEDLYIPFWKQQLPFIAEAISSGCSKAKKIDVAQLQSYSRNGNRKTLRFRVTIQDGIASTNTNSAIARDLCKFLNSAAVSKLLDSLGDKVAVINLINGDSLNISIQD